MDTTICSYYNPVIKKRRKKTGAMLGKITESDGFIASDGRKKKISASKDKIAVREFGFTDFLEVYGKLIEQKLNLFFPKHYIQIIYMAYVRFVHISPINRMPLLIEKSMPSVDEKEKIYPQKLIAVLIEIVQDTS